MTTIVYEPDSPVQAVTNLRVYVSSRLGVPVLTAPAMLLQPDGTWTFEVTPDLSDGDYLTAVTVTRDGVSFEDADDSFTIAAPVAPSVPAWTPGADRVAGLIPSRTQPNDGSGVSTGTFTAVTRPTATQVDALSAEVAREVELATGGSALPADLQDSAADVASYGAAAQVELGYYRQADSRYAELNARYEAKLKRLVAGVIARRDAETIPGEGAADLPPSPQGCFPLPMTTLTEQW